ncbi:hypothetical protein C2845_PM01G27670 [Panicum miliaceum]|uniref:Uncharacterized protein n=1 Tax=Panicum miliaceum TaxID=4540 RepID=A0A3L6TIH5_PANMI|nr:hypothetical protein C2845_PM01G27670 [Panicum miliaceum]
MREMPECIHNGPEHDLIAVDSDTAAKNPGLNYPADVTGDTLWIKVSSAAGLLQALANSTEAELADILVYAYIMPTTPLEDAARISAMVQGLEFLPRPVTLHVYNPTDLNNKVAAYNTAGVLLGEIKAASAAVGNTKVQLAAAAEAKLKHAQDLMMVYDQAKAAYEATRAHQNNHPTGTLDDHQLRVLAASSRLLIAREVATSMREAVVSMESLADSLANRAADLEGVMARPTFMGCPLPGGGLAIGN